METASVLAHSKVTTPFGFSPLSNHKLPLRPFNKHLRVRLSTKNSPNQTSLKTPFKCSLSIASSSSSRNLSAEVLQNPFSLNPLYSFPTSRTTTRSHLLQPLKCSYSNAPAASESQNSLLEKLSSLSLDSLKSLSQLTPIAICKWSLLVSIAIAAAKWTVILLLNPFFWMYFSWTWVFWPWFLAIGVAIYGLYCLRKHLAGEANIFEQLAVVTAAFTWLTLVPPAHFNGFLEGWPFVFFFVYHYFFFFNVSVRKRLYGDYYPREHDPKWDVSPPSWLRLLFCAGVMVGHWLAAFEGPELHLIPGGWSNLWVWALIMLTLFMQYHSTLYLANYTEKVVVPTAVVQFGPYRWVRHPIYASTMLLFVTYFLALRAPLSSLFVVAVCLMHYGHKAKLEENLMVETFGEKYADYTSKVKYRLIPLVY